jgi:WD40 repeat protein/DNA-binding SARP family transcriptional activator
MVDFTALGTVAVRRHGELVNVGGPRQRRLLAVLLIHRNTVVSTDRLADAVFAGEPTPAAATTLRSYVARIRKVIEDQEGGPEVLTQSPGYVLRVPAEAFDVSRCEELVSSARRASSRGDQAAAAAQLQEALALWQGEAYAEFADEEWAHPEAQRLTELRLAATESLGEAELACGRADEWVPRLEALAREHPLRETFQAQLMLALYRTGRQADALRVYRDHRSLLVDELGVEPTPATQELERRILAHDPDLTLSESAGRPLRGYRLGERLGTGPDGTTFAARPTGLDRDVVIRVLRAEVADDPDFVRGFESLAHRVAFLRHPAIVPILDYWREPGAAYVVLRRLHGGDLADRLARGRLTRPQLASLVTRIGGALLVATDAGLVHGRLTPSNVVFDDAGEPCLTDFALTPTVPARTTGDDVRDLALLVRGCLPGEPAALTDVLALGGAAVGRPTMAEFVAKLLAVLDAAEPPETGLVNPYKGLQSFDETDAADFFGRSELVDEAIDRLAGDGSSSRLLLVVGGSGTGKSSVVRAGLLPRLRAGVVSGSEDWFITTMLPGAWPFDALADGLRRIAVSESGDLARELAHDAAAIDRVIRNLVPDGGQLLLVVDQLEELFTLATPADQRALLDGLSYAVSAPDSRLRVVATLRADFYDRPLGVPGFGAVVQDATVAIAAMSSQDLEAAVVEPAERAGRRVERALVTELVTAVVDESAALPALQFTLFELAERCDETLTMAAYEELGRIEGAIAARAEGIYLALDHEQRSLVRQLFEQLVVVTGEGESARRRAARGEVVESLGPGAEAVIDDLTNARLLSLDRHPHTRVPVVELAHEALVREWPRLRGWIEEDRGAILVLGQLRDAATAWEELGREPGALYRGTRLELALGVTQRRDAALPRREREFLDASLDARREEQRAAAQVASRQARANRRLRAQLGVIALALVAALTVGLVAVNQRGEAEQQRRVATARELAAASDANLAEDPERSMLLALAAIDATRNAGEAPIPEAVSALHRAVSESRIVLSVPGLGGALDWSPHGNLFVTEGPEESGIIDLRDSRTGESVRSFHGHDVDVNDVAFSPDGDLLATTGDDGFLRVWDPQTGRLVTEQRGRADYVWGPSFSHDGQRVAASWTNEGKTRVFDIASGRLVATLDTPGAVSTSFSPDDERLVAGDTDRPHAEVYQVSTGRLVADLHAAKGWFQDVSYSPDGRWIAASGGGEALARIWDAETLQPRFVVAGQTGSVQGLAWSHDGSRLASVSDDGSAQVSEIDAGGVRTLLTVSAQDTSNGLQSVAFSPDDSQVMTGDYALASVKIWDISDRGGAELMNLPGVPESRAGVSFLDGSHDVVARRPGAGVVVWDAETGRPRLSLTSRTAGDDVGQLAVNASSGFLATSGIWLPVDGWDARTGAHLFRYARGAESPAVLDLAWSPDGKLLAIVLGYDDHAGIVIVDRSGSDLAELEEEPGVFVRSVSFSNDGRLIAATRWTPDRRDPAREGVRIWDWAAGDVLRTIESRSLLATFDSSGNRLATAPYLEGVAQVWDVRTGDLVTTMAGEALIEDIAFDEQGGRVATGGSDGVVRLWDAATGTQQMELRGHEVGVNSVAFSPDGSHLVSHSDEGLIRVWTLDLDELRAIAHARLTRELSDSECRQYLHLDACSERS